MLLAPVQAPSIVEVPGPPTVKGMHKYTQDELDRAALIIHSLFRNFPMANKGVAAATIQRAYRRYRAKKMEAMFDEKTIELPVFTSPSTNYTVPTERQASPDAPESDHSDYDDRASVYTTSKQVWAASPVTESNPVISLRDIFAILDYDGDGRITCSDVAKILKSFGAKALKKEVVDLIWELDDDSDNAVSYEEYKKNYKLCFGGSTGSEPRRLFSISQFLLTNRMRTPP
eukprot:Colp12_sorted_trinity150504_noHs@28028